MYGMNKCGKLFADDLIEFLLQADFIQYQCQMYIYYKYTLDVIKIVVLYYDDDCVYVYISEAIGKWFVDAIGERFHVNFLGYSHWFTLIRISLMKDHYISVDQAIYATSIIEKYLDTATVKTSTNL